MFKGSSSSGPIVLLSTGMLIQGRYEVISVLGDGGMGTVYKVRQIDANRILALKLLHSIIANDEESVKRFRREAKALARLNHTNIVNFLHFGFLDDGAPFAALEFLDGKDLSSVLKSEVHLSINRTLKIMRQVLQALSCLHAEGVIHRDLKPGNIILLEEPEADFVKLVDFGLAKLITGKESEKLTATGLLIGSIHYMSPEQSRGERVDVRSDIYSCACIMYELLSGRKPFEADSPIGVLYKHTNEIAAPFAETEFAKQVPATLEAICRKGMAKKPEHRFQSTEEMLTAIDLFEAGKTSPFSIIESKTKRNPLLVAAGILVFIGLLLGAAVCFHFDSRKRMISSVKIHTSEERRAAAAEREIQRLLKNVAVDRKDIAKKGNKAVPDDYRKLVFDLAWLGRVQSEELRFEEAQQTLAEAFDNLPKTGDSEQYESMRLLILRGRMYSTWGKFNKAQMDFSKALQRSSEIWGKGSIQWQDVTMHNSTVLAKQHKYAQCKKNFDELKEYWLELETTNPKVAVARFQSITMGGPSRLEILRDAILTVIKVKGRTSTEEMARHEAMVAAVHACEICSRADASTFMRQTRAELEQMADSDPNKARLLRELIH